MLELSSTYTVNLNRIWGDATKLYWATSPDYPSTKQERQCHMQEYQAIKKILSREQHIELKLRKELMTLQGPSLSPKIKQRVQQLEDQVTQLEQLKQLFQTNDKTPLPKKLMLAEKTLNIATIALTPHRMNYSFLLRAYHSAAMRNALLGLLCCMLLSSSITNPIAALFLTTTALLTGQQIYRFFKEDQQCRKACSDYKEAHKQPPIPHRTSDPERLAPS